MLGSASSPFLSGEVRSYRQHSLEDWFPSSCYPGEKEGEGARADEGNNLGQLNVVRGTESMSIAWELVRNAASRPPQSPAQDPQNRSPRMGLRNLPVRYLQHSVCWRASALH